MPKKIESANKRLKENDELELMALKEQILSQCGLVVNFDTMPRPMLPSPQEIPEILDLEVLAQTPDGVIYGIKEQSSAGFFS